SFPGGRPLPKRENLVLTHDPAFTREGAVICRSKAEIMDKIADQDPDRVMVIGGAEIYRLFLKDCRRAYVTRIDAAVEDADCFFPNLEEDPDWICTSVSEPMTENGLTFRFCIYENSACSA
ncbi:MAG: dihydrofolate reductase, partial [Lachnospiraceae bacterium]